jgi:hypothetical protein
LRSKEALLSVQNKEENPTEKPNEIEQINTNTNKEVNENNFD